MLLVVAGIIRVGVLDGENYPAGVERDVIERKIYLGVACDWLRSVGFDQIVYQD